MKQEYFVVVLAHSLRGRLRRIHIPHQAVYAILALALLGCFSMFGIVASYARMAWKVANYNALKREADSLRSRYQNLQKVVSQTNQQLATLQLYAKEVSVAYGIREKLSGPTGIASEGKLTPTFAESLADYDFLKRTDVMALDNNRSHSFFSTTSQPSLWPVDGRLIGAFGMRSDPFNGEGEFHKGVDLHAPMGAPVHATADGVVVYADTQSGGYGKLIVVQHGGGIETYYAHLSRFYVHVGQEVRRGDMIGAVGATGRVTAPHLHYEVRIGGGPVNPYRYLANAAVFQPVKKEPF
ncbi:MAG TPA: M23 family metallopeptidase [Candidatus Limnocylindrales bacterium]|nr:M23 family metallopeptidase [Candidatus Limnocylindrales bacterium]